MLSIHGIAQINASYAMLRIILFRKIRIVICGDDIVFHNIPFPVRSPSLFFLCLKGKKKALINFAHPVSEKILTFSKQACYLHSSYHLSPRRARKICRSGPYQTLVFSSRKRQNSRRQTHPTVLPVFSGPPEADCPPHERFPLCSEALCQA